MEDKRTPDEIEFLTRLKDAAFSDLPEKDCIEWRWGTVSGGNNSGRAITFSPEDERVRWVSHLLLPRSSEDEVMRWREGCLTHCVNPKHLRWEFSERKAKDNEKRKLYEATEKAILRELEIGGPAHSPAELAERLDKPKYRKVALKVLPYLVKNKKVVTASEGWKVTYSLP